MNRIRVCMKSSRLMFSVFLDHFSPYMLRQGFFVNLELTSSISIDSQVVQEIPLTIPSKNWDYKQDVSTTRYCVGYWR